MKNIIFAILLVVCGVAYAQKETVYTAKELEQKLETQRIGLKQEALENKVAAQDKSIEEKIVAHDKRIDEAQSHLSNSISLINIGAAFLVAATALGGYLINRSNRKATKEVKQEIEKLKTDTNEEVERIWDNADLVLKNARLEMNEKINEINSLLEKAKGHVVNIESFESNAKNLVEKIQKNKEGGDNKEIKAETKRTVKEIDEKLPVGQYAFDDWFLKGFDAYNKKMYEDAIFYFKKAFESNEFKTKSDRNRAGVYNNWGNALSDLAQLKESEDMFEESFEKYEKATQIDKNYAFAYNNWGSALSDLAQLKNDEKLFEAAFEKYDMAIRIDEDYDEPYNNWGAALMDLTNIKGDIFERQEIIKEKLLKAYELGNKTSVYNLTCLYSLLNEKDEAIEWFEKALKESKYTRGDFKTEPELDNLRQDPRFEELLNKYRPLNEEE